MANANVFARLIQPVKSVQEYDDERDAREVNRLGLQEKRRANALAEAAALQQTNDRNALQRIAQESGGDTTRMIQGLRGSGSAGLMTQADALEKGQLDRRNTESQIAERGAKTTGEQMKAAVDRLSLVGQLAGGIRDQATYEAALGFLGASGIDVAKLGAPAQYDPAVVERFRTQAMSEKDRLEQAFNQIKQAEVVRSNQATEANTIRGQDITRANNQATVGASLVNAAAVREAAKLQADATRAAASARRDQDTEMKLADDYRTQSKSFKEAKDAYAQLSATLGSATTSPAATLAAATKFMKVLDPGSVVRESELGMALNASGVIDRALNYISTLQSGKKLTATQAADFKKTSEQIYQAAQSVQRDIDKDYQDKAKAYGLRPEMVTQDLGQNAKVMSWGDLK